MTDVLTRPAGLPDAVVRYAEHDDGLLDVHVPHGPARGLLHLVHGGYWRAEWDRRHTRPLAEALRDEGWLVVTPEYRRTGAVGALAGGWPTTYGDVRAAVTSAPDLLRGLGLEVPDGPRVALGHSAGGHLALLLACDDVGLDRVVALAPVGDLHDAYARGLDDGAAEALMGGAPAELPDAYAAADPALRLAGGARTPVVVVHGTADPLVPVANSDWARDLAGVELRLLPGVDHFEVIDPTSSTWPVLLQALDPSGAPPLSRPPAGRPQPRRRPAEG